MSLHSGILGLRIVNLCLCFALLEDSQLSFLHFQAGNLTFISLSRSGLNDFSLEEVKYINEKYIKNSFIDINYYSNS